MVAQKDAILASELFKGDWYEGANTAYYEDLGMLVGQAVADTVDTRCELFY